MRDAKPTGHLDDRSLELQDGAEVEQAGMLLAQAAIEGLEDLAAGRLLEGAELDRALSVRTAHQSEC